MAEIEDLVDRAASAGGRVPRRETGIALAFLPGHEPELCFDAGGLERGAVIRALRNLTGLPASVRGEVEERLYGFYQQEIEDGSCDFDSAQAQLDWEADFTGDFSDPVAATSPETVWPLVRFTRIDVRGTLRGPAPMVRIEGQAAWDGEHGVVLHFDDGRTLVAVTGYGVFL